MKVVYSFFVPGSPKAQPRPRVTKTGHAYNPDTAAEWKDAVKGYCLLYRKPRIEDPVKLTVRFYLPRPKRLEKEERMIPHTSKPDTDNLLKAVMDAMTDVGVWKDDSLVYSTVADKWYAQGETGAKIIVMAGL